MNVIPVRTSERTCFKTCRQQWHWAYNERIRLNRPRPALFLGDLVHQALAIFYPPGIRRGPKPTRTFEKLYQKHMDDGGSDIYMKDVDDPARRVSILDMGLEMLTNYLEQYGDDEEFEILSPEHPFQVDVHSPRTGKYMFTYTGTVDAAVRRIRDGRIGFLEHKTGVSLDPFGAPYELDEQSGAYWTFAPEYLRSRGWLPPGEDLDFILFNRLRKAFKDKRPKNDVGMRLNKPSKTALLERCDELGLGYTKATKVDDLIEILTMEGEDPLLLGEVSKSQPPPLFKREYVYRTAGDRAIIFKRALNEFLEMQMVRKGKLAVYKNPGRHCVFCEFRAMCEVHESGSDWEAIRDTEMVPWDPYEVHHEGLEDE